MRSGKLEGFQISDLLWGGFGDKGIRVGHRAGGCWGNVIGDVTLSSSSVYWLRGVKSTVTLHYSAGIEMTGGEGAAVAIGFVTGVCIVATGIEGAGRV